MPPQVFNKICERCEKRYLTYEEDKNFCTDNCKFKKIYCEKRKIKDTPLTKADKQCKHCGEKTKTIFCNKQCQYAYDRLRSKQKTVKKSYENRDKSKRRRISFEELNRRSEWKRLNDDESWLKRFNASRYN
jgi:hypothetical protein